MIKILEKLGRKRIIYDRINTDQIYIERYYLLFTEAVPRPKWFPFNVLLHHICKSDPSDLHDHPWCSISIILKGGYWEITPEGKFWRKPGSIIFRKATDQHRLELDKTENPEEVWTLFLVGVRVRDWGFIKDGVWIQWQEYLSNNQVT